MTDAQAYNIRPARDGDFEEWFTLYEPYSRIVESPVTREIGEGVWKWIVDPKHSLEALVAERNGRLVGFTHYRPFPRTLDANEACFLDDIYVGRLRARLGPCRAVHPAGG